MWDTAWATLKKESDKEPPVEKKKKPNVKFFPFTLSIKSFDSMEPVPDIVHGTDRGDNINGLRIPSTTYRVGRRIGTGSFAQVRLGRNLKTNATVAVKLESKEITIPRLEKEWEFYKVLNRTPAPGIPKAYHFGTCGKNYALVMELLGPSLQQVFVNCELKFSLQTVLMIAIQMVTRLEFIHSQHIINRDIKPDNILICKQPSRDNTIFLVDFGLSKYYVDPVTKAHIPLAYNTRLNGTSRYMSIHTHMGYEQSRRDDLESLGYVLIYFLRGKLPWQGLPLFSAHQRYKRILDLKKTLTPEKLCEGLPPEFAQYLHYVRKLEFKETPNYEFLCQLFKLRVEKEGYDPDGCMDWNREMDPRISD